MYRFQRPVLRRVSISLKTCPKRQDEFVKVISMHNIFTQYLIWATLVQFWQGVALRGKDSHEKPGLSYLGQAHIQTRDKPGVLQDVICWAASMVFFHWMMPKEAAVIHHKFLSSDWRVCFSPRDTKTLARTTPEENISHTNSHREQAQAEYEAHEHTLVQSWAKAVHDTLRLKSRQRPIKTPFLILFIICACALQKMTMKTGPSKTGLAGKLATATHWLRCCFPTSHWLNWNLEAMIFLLSEIARGLLQNTSLQTRYCPYHTRNSLKQRLRGSRKVKTSHLDLRSQVCLRSGGADHS